MPRVVSVGRLDLNTEGLLLLTNDGGLSRALELPATGWLRRYRVRAYGKIGQERLDGLRQGIEIDGVRYGAIEATLDREQGDNVWLTFAMREGKNREIRNVLGALGLKVNRLIRVSYGPFQLGELPAGAVTEIRTRMLREQLGERIAAVAGADFSGPIVEREAPEEEAPSRRADAKGSPPHSRGDAYKAGQQKSGARGRPAGDRPQGGGRHGGHPQRKRNGPRDVRLDREGPRRDRPNQGRLNRDRPNGDRTRGERPHGGHPPKGRPSKGRPYKGRRDR
jgi:23S rRNA pseudouridine2605 synthase